MVALVSGTGGTVSETALSVQAAEAVEMSEVVPAGTAEVAEVGAGGSVEVVEALGHQLLCAVAGGAACSLIFAGCFVVPAPFSGVGLLWGHVAEPVVFLPAPVTGF